VVATNRTNSPGEILIRLKDLSSGTKTVFASPQTTPVDVGGVPMAPSDAETKLDAFIVLFTSPTTIRASLKKSVLDRDTVTPAVLAFIKDYEDGVRAKLGRQNPDLQKFGMTPAGKRKQRTSAEKADSADTGQATRVLRQTKGPKQKAAIKAPPVTKRAATKP